MGQQRNTEGWFSLAGAGFLWGWSFLFFFSSQSDSTVSPSFWVGDATYLGATLAAALCSAVWFRKGLLLGQLHRMGSAAFVLMLMGSTFLGFSSIGAGDACAIVGKMLAGPGQGMFWIAWTAVLSRFDIERAENAFLQWIPVLVAVLVVSSLPASNASAAQAVRFLLMILLPVAAWLTFRRALALSIDVGGTENGSDEPYREVRPVRETLGSVLWSFANLSVALAVIMVAWNAFLFHRMPDMSHVKVVFSVGTLMALPIVWCALRVTRRFGPSSLYRWAVPIMTLGILFDFIPGTSMIWSACLCLGIVSVGFEGMYHLAFIYAAKRFARQSVFVASLGVIATTLGGLAGATAWAFCLEHVTPATVGVVFLVALFVLVLCSSCAPRSEGISGLKMKKLPPSALTVPATEFEERCQALAKRYGLTSRESEVMLLLGQGRSRAFIREALFISKGTVDTHVHHIYSKMGIGSKDELMSIVFEAVGDVREDDTHRS